MPWTWKHATFLLLGKYIWCMNIARNMICSTFTKPRDEMMMMGKMLTTPISIKLIVGTHQLYYISNIFLITNFSKKNKEPPPPELYWKSQKGPAAPCSMCHRSSDESVRSPFAPKSFYGFSIGIFLSTCNEPVGRMVRWPQSEEESVLSKRHGFLAAAGRKLVVWYYGCSLDPCADFLFRRCIEMLVWCSFVWRRRGLWAGSICC